MSKTIVFTAQQFGFGPVSKMISISENTTDCRKIFFGAGTAYDMACLYNFDEIYNLPHQKEAEIVSLLEKADLFVNIMDFSLGKLAEKVGCPYFVIDSLLWFYPFRPPVDNADIYFCQNFLDQRVEQKIEEYGFSNAKLLGPILCNNFERKEKVDQVIVNFAGCDGQIEDSIIEVGQNSSYPLVILRNLLPILTNHFHHVLVTGRERVMDICEKEFGKGNNIQFQMLSHKDMMREIYRSQILFSVPGVQSFYDAAGKLPIFFLPPHNHSHSENLDFFIKKEIARYYFHWREIYDFPINRYNTRKEKIALILKCANRFAKDKCGQRILQKKALEFVEDKRAWPQLVEIQKNAIKSLGSDGVSTIINSINKILYSSESQPAPAEAKIL